MWRLHPRALMGALWTLLAFLAVRRRVRVLGVAAVPPPAPRLSAPARAGAEGVLHRLSPTCLEKALLRQAWLAADGDPRDVVIGLPGRSFGEQPAHAWVDGTDPASARRYLELHRLPYRTAPLSLIPKKRVPTVAGLPNASQKAALGTEKSAVYSSAGPHKRSGKGE